MTREPDAGRRPRWRKTRWWAVGMLSFAAAYPASLGPAYYCVGRRWLPSAAVLGGFYAPINRAIDWAYDRGAYYPGMRWSEEPVAFSVRQYWQLLTVCGRLGVKHGGNAPPDFRVLPLP